MQRLDAWMFAALLLARLLLLALQSSHTVKQLMYRIGPTCPGRCPQTATYRRVRYCRGVMLGRRPKYTRLVDGSRTYLGVVERQQG